MYLAALFSEGVLRSLYGFRSWRKNLKEKKFGEKIK